MPPGVTRIRLLTGEHSASDLRLDTRPGHRETHREPASGHDLVFREQDAGSPA